MPPAHDCRFAPIYRAGRQWGFPGRAACAPPRPHPPLGTLLSYQPDGSVPAPAPPAAPATPRETSPASTPHRAGTPRPCPPALPGTGPPGRARAARGCAKVGAAALSGAPPGCSGGRGGVQGPSGGRGLPSARLRNARNRRPAGVAGKAPPGRAVSHPVPDVRVQPAPFRLHSPRHSPFPFPLLQRRGAPPEHRLQCSSRLPLKRYFTVTLVLAAAAPGTSPRPRAPTGGAAGAALRAASASTGGYRKPFSIPHSRRDFAPTRETGAGSRWGRALPRPEAAPAPSGPALGPGSRCAKRAGDFCAPAAAGAGSGPGPGHLSPAEGEAPAVVQPGSPCTARRPRGCGQGRREGAAPVGRESPLSFTKAARRSPLGDPGAGSGRSGPVGPRPGGGQLPVPGPVPGPAGRPRAGGAGRVGLCAPPVPERGRPRACGPAGRAGEGAEGGRPPRRLGRPFSRGGSEGRGG